MQKKEISFRIYNLCLFDYDPLVGMTNQCPDARAGTTLSINMTTVVGEWSESRMYNPGNLSESQF